MKIEITPEELIQLGEQLNSKMFEFLRLCEQEYYQREQERRK